MGESRNRCIRSDGRLSDPASASSFPQGLCEGDMAPLGGDGVVDGTDLGTLLGAWGSNDVGADLTHDGVVNGADIGVLLGGWTG